MAPRALELDVAPYQVHIGGDAGPVARRWRQHALRTGGAAAVLVVSVVAMVAVLSGQPKRGSALPEELLGMPTLPSMAPLAALRPGKDGYFESLKRKRGGLGRGKRIGKRIGKKIGKIGAKIGAKIGSMSKKIGRIGAAAAAGSSAASTSSSSSSAISSSTQSSSSSMSSAASFAEGKFQGDFWALPHDVAQNVKEIPDLDGLGAPSKVIESEVIDFDSAKFANLGWHDDFAVRWKGMLEILEADTYKFLSTSDDGSKIYVNNVMVVDNDGLHPPKDAEGSLFLDVGTYPIKVEFFEHGGGADLVVKYSGADTGGQFKLIRSTTLDGTSGKSASEPRPRKDSAPVLPEADPGEPCCATQCSMFDEEEEQEVGQKDEATTASFKGEIWSLRSEDGSYPFGKPEKLPDFGALGNPQSTIESEVIDLNDEAWKQIGWRDNFAARWTGLLVVRAGGTYKFFTESDDGSKLFINGDLVVDNDGLHAPLTKEGTMDLEAGQYEIKVLFFEHQGGADIRVKYAGPDTDGETKLLKARSMSLQGSGEEEQEVGQKDEATTASFKGEIWSLRSEDGSYPFGKPEKLPDFGALGNPQSTIESEVIDLNDEAWKQIGWRDNFAARWTGLLVVRAGGTYKFFTESDDGSKLFINGDLVVDNDGLHAPLTKEGTMDLEAGQYEIKVLFFEHQGGADIRVKYAGPDTDGETKLLKARSMSLQGSGEEEQEVGQKDEATTASFKGEIWSLRSEDGSYPFGKPEKLPDFGALGNPQSTIESEVIDLNDEAWKQIGWRDNFAARWTGLLVVRAGGTYKFFTESDDGSKLFINGDLVVDNDGLHAPLTKEGTMDLEAGQYEIKVLFFEHQGGADIRVKYAGPDTDGETKLLKARSMSLQGSGEQDAKMKASASVMGASTSVNRWSMLRKELHAEASQVARKSSRAGQNRGSSRRLLADGVCDCAKCPKVPGFEAAYYKMEGASSVDDIPTGAPDWVGSCLDIDFDAKAFHSIAEGFPQANFGARWKGEMQVLVAGSYNFYSKSDDGSKVYVNKRLVVDYDGLHGANEWKQGTIELEAGWHVVEVSYFERSGDQKIEIKYSGPDTLGTPVLLRGFHVGIIPAQDPTPPDVMFPGFMAQYFKLPVDTVNAVPDLRGRTPFLTGISLDVDYDSESFKEVSDELTDGFAVRWTGEIKVTQGGMYTFFSNSDDGSLIIVNDAVVVNNDGLHGMGDWIEGVVDLLPGFYPVTIDFFENGGDEGIKIKYSGPDTSGKPTFLRGQHVKAQEANLCSKDYTVLSGSSAGWNQIDGRGFGEKVEDCGMCAYVCSDIDTCRSYECSPTELRCNILTESRPTNEAYKDYFFCAKDLSVKTREMVLGWQVQYFKLSYQGTLKSVPDLRGRSADRNGTTMEIDYDAASMNDDRLLDKQFPEDKFAARWTGKMQVVLEGEYTFMTSSDDGSLLTVDNTLVVNNDGVHRMGDWKQGKLTLLPGWHDVTVDYFENGGDEGIQVKYSGPDTFDKMAFLRAYHGITNPCTTDYTPMQGDIGMWGKVGARGGGEEVEDCAQCADLCSSLEECGSFECSPTELKCNLNTVINPTNDVANADYMFCSKKVVSQQAAALRPGWVGKYFVISDYVKNVPDMRGREPLFTQSCLDINFDKAEFEGIANGFPSDHFAVRWEGLVQVTTLGNYSFYAASDDGSRVIVENSLVIDHDGEHGMGQFVKGTIELEPGLHPVTVDYFERGGDQGIMIKYSGPDTSDAVVSLRVFHEPANLCGSGYKRIPGAIWGAIDGNEGGDSVEDCGECAAMCSGVKSCLSYECSDTELKCNTNTAIVPTVQVDFKDYMFCAKDLSKPSALMLPGLKGKFFKIGDYVTSVPDLKGLKPDFNFTSLDVDFDRKAFGLIGSNFPEDHFAARWTGKIKITKGGEYTFYTSSDDGSRVVLDNKVVVEHDGLHGMEFVKGKPTALQPGWYPLTVDYFESGGEQGVEVKYSGPDTFGKETFLRGYHAEANPCGLAFTRMKGHDPGPGKIEGQDGDSRVESCDVCAAMCSKEGQCLSFECSPSELKCKMNTVNKPTEEANNKDYVFCSKDVIDASEIAAAVQVHGHASGGAAAQASAHAMASASAAASASASASVSANFAFSAGNASADAKAYADSAKEYADAAKAYATAGPPAPASGAGKKAGGFRVLPPSGVGTESGAANAKDVLTTHKKWPKLGTSITFPPKNPYPPGVNDPFGFVAKAFRAESAQKKQWSNFKAMVKKAKRTDPEGPMHADKNAIKTLQDKMDRLGRWKGVAWPGLVYPENHWQKQQKWAGDYHDGEEKKTPPWRNTGKPAYYYRIPPPVKYHLTYDPFGALHSPKGSPA